MEILWKQALKTFGGRRNSGYKFSQSNFEKLWSLMNKITAEDVKLDIHFLDYIKVQPSSMCVMDVFESEDLEISIFILKQGVTMPMHDHPGMHGLLKVISGTVEVKSYSTKVSTDNVLRPNEEIPAIRHRPVHVSASSPACILTPWDKNLHEISCLEGPAAFLDILSPPYNVKPGKDSRPCTVFREINSKLYKDSVEGNEHVKLLIMESPPDIDCINVGYMGPPLQ
ncbi:2-aminoethanethiol dioxygenase isoform X2 [Prorops nasuta]